MHQKDNVAGPPDAGAYQNNINKKRMRRTPRYFYTVLYKSPASDSWQVSFHELKRLSQSVASTVVVVQQRCCCCFSTGGWEQPELQAQVHSSETLNSEQQELDKKDLALPGPPSPEARY